jgi:hypothetical protein
MNVRFFTESDYPTVCSWWKDHEWPSIPLIFLPKTGIIVDDCAVGFVYGTDSKLCWLEFVVVDKRAEKERRRKALDILISEATNIAKECGYVAMFSSVSHKGLIERYKNHNFQITDQNMTNLIRTL